MTHPAPVVPVVPVSATAKATTTVASSGTSSGTSPADFVTMDLVDRFIDARTGARPRTLIAYRTALKLVVDWQLRPDRQIG